MSALSNNSNSKKPVIFYLSLLLFIGFAGLLGYATMNGNLFVEGPILTSVIWGWVTLADLYMSFLLFGSWVLYKERFKLKGWIWFVLILTLGNLITCLYILLALRNANYDLAKTLTPSQ